MNKLLGLVCVLVFMGKKNVLNVFEIYSNREYANF